MNKKEFVKKENKEDKRIEEIKKEILYNPDEKDVFEFTGKLKAYIVELFEITSWLKFERDNEVKWASHYLKESEKLEVKLEKAKEIIKAVTINGMDGVPEGAWPLNCTSWEEWDEKAEHWLKSLEEE